MKNTSILSALVFAAAALSQPAMTVAADSWQEKILFSPSPAQIEMEDSRHRIMIYHGLKDTQINQVMNQQFDRIEHMMFTGTVVTDVNGEEIFDPATGLAMVEDDGC